MDEQLETHRPSVGKVPVKRRGWHGQAQVPTRRRFPKDDVRHSQAKAYYRYLLYLERRFNVVDGLGYWVCQGRPYLLSVVRSSRMSLSNTKNVSTIMIETPLILAQYDFVLLPFIA